MSDETAEFLIFDFETLSSKPSEAPIISMGAIAGRWEYMDTVESLRLSGFYRNVDAMQQIKELGLKTNTDTLIWWSRQGDEAKKVLNAKDKISLKETLVQFNAWCTSMQVTHNTTVFIRAPHFDYTIYENLLEKVGMDIYRPFSHWKVRDTRSLIDILYNVDRGYVPGFKAVMSELNLIEHNALDDTIKEYWQLKDYYQSK
jgi:hypothetical protein